MGRGLLQEGPIGPHRVLHKDFHRIERCGRMLAALTGDSLWWLRTSMIHLIIT